MQKTTTEEARRVCSSTSYEAAAEKPDDEPTCHCGHWECNHHAGRCLIADCSCDQKLLASFSFREFL